MVSQQAHFPAAALFVLLAFPGPLLIVSPAQTVPSCHFVTKQPARCSLYQPPFVYFGISVGAGSLGFHFLRQTVIDPPFGPKIMESSGTQHMGAQFLPQPSKRLFPSGSSVTTSGRLQIGHVSSSRSLRTLSRSPCPNFTPVHYATILCCLGHLQSLNPAEFFNGTSTLHCLTPI
jgi:hypothetical protein